MSQLSIIVTLTVRSDSATLAQDHFVVAITDTPHLMQEIETRINPMTYGVLLEACKVVLSAAPPASE